MVISDPRWLLLAEGSDQCSNNAHNRERKIASWSLVVMGQLCQEGLGGGWLPASGKLCGGFIVF